MTSSTKNTYVAPGAKLFALEGLQTVCQTSLGGLSSGSLIEDPTPIVVTPMDMNPGL